MSSYDHRAGYAADAGASGATTGGVPGKRTLTQSLPPVQRRSLADQQRVDFDTLSAENVTTRDTIEGSTDRGPNLTDRQLERARRLNPKWIRKLNVAKSVFSNETVDSSAFAFAVAEKQATAGVQVDGIAGPKTVRAVAGEPPGQSRSKAGADDDLMEPDFDGPAPQSSAGRSRHDDLADPFANDDPFGMHLIGK